MAGTLKIEGELIDTLGAAEEPDADCALGIEGHGPSKFWVFSKTVSRVAETWSLCLGHGCN